MIIASKQQEVNSAKEIVGLLDVKNAQKLFKQELENLNNILAEDVMDITTNFNADGDYPTNLLFDNDNEEWKHDLIKS